MISAPSVWNVSFSFDCRVSIQKNTIYIVVPTVQKIAENFKKTI